MIRHQLLLAHIGMQVKLTSFSGCKRSISLFCPYERLLLLFALVLLLTPIGIATAQTSMNYVAPRSVMTGGGSASSASYAVISVTGQPATDVVKSASYKVSGGFLRAQRQESQIDHRFWLPVILK